MEADKLVRMMVQGEGRLTSLSGGGRDALKSVNGLDVDAGFFVSEVVTHEFTPGGGHAGGDWSVLSDNPRWVCSKDDDEEDGDFLESDEDEFDDDDDDDFDDLDDLDDDFDDDDEEDFDDDLDTDEEL